MSVTTVSGERHWCAGTGVVRVRLPTGEAVSVDVIVVTGKPLGFGFILGMNGIKALHGVAVTDTGKVTFGVQQPGMPARSVAAGAVVESSDDDFTVTYEAISKKWTVEWKWCDGKRPEKLKNTISEYRIPPDIRDDYEEELAKWVENGWLVPHDESLHGEVKGTIPLMAVVQPNKAKTRPVMDFRELNQHLQLHTADADVCNEKTREWRRFGQNVALIDLRQAYLQIHVHETLWAYQTVVFRGQRWCLTRLGFGLSVAPLVMKKVLQMALSFDSKIDGAASAYVDDICVREDVATAEEVITHLKRHGLLCKPPQRLMEGARVLGLRVCGQERRLYWARDNNNIDMPSKLSRRAVFSLCGRLTSHLPVCSWLRVAASFVKRRASAVTRGWDDEIVDPELCTIVADMLQRVKASDPARGRWDVEGEEAVVWVDASSLALAASLEVNGDAIEDACWLRQNPDSHINLAELDALVRGINLAVSWKMKRLTLKTDSKSVYHWVSDALSGKARLKTKAASEMLIRRRLETVKTIISEYSLQVKIELVPSADNRADILTRVPKRWLSPACSQTMCAAAVSELDIATVHETSGHPGIRRTLRLCRRLDPTVDRKRVRSVVRQCRQCQSIDPAPQRWQHGSLGVAKGWDRVSMDVCHVGDLHYLTLVDCGPSRYAIWRKLRHQDSSSVITQLEQVFLERGPPTEILTDNAKSFRSATFYEFLSRWGVRVRYRAANQASGNSVVERNHRTVKTIAARKQCSVAEAVYRYNVMPRSDDPRSSPANTLFNYEVRVPDVPSAEEELAVQGHRYSVGYKVWIRDASRRCDVPSALGTVSRIISDQNVEVDGISRHVRDLRIVVLPPAQTQLESAPVRTWGAVDNDVRAQDANGAEREPLRRSDRERRPATLLQYDDL